MALLRRSAALLAESGESLAEVMVERMLFTSGREVSDGEVRSWRRSIPTLAADLVDAGLPDVEVLLEHRLPLSSRRVDAILAGHHPKTGRPSFVVVELKQWSSFDTFEDDPSLVQVHGLGREPHVHPLLQVSGYVDYLRDFVPALGDDDADVSGVAYLHNATEASLVGSLEPEVAGDVRWYSGDRRGEFLTFLRGRLDPNVRGAEVADMLLSARTAPSRQLLQVAAAEVQEREQFVLLDEQRGAYELVLHAVERARAANSKTVVVVTGGPGSGKSVIALSLLGELARRGRTVVHATGSRSFTQTLRKVAGRRSKRTQSLFKYFNQFMEAEPNGLDVLILDEAHRIRETSADRYTRASLRSGRPQLDELMSAARVPLFLLDQNQVVRPGELGTLEDITAYAERLGLPVHVISLADQFRCGGSEAFIYWVERLLGLVEGGPMPWQPDPAFALQLVDTPQALDEALRARSAEGYGARMTAGYCWPWSDPVGDGLVRDVVIDGWSRPWNVRGDRAIGTAPPAALWATDPGGFHQVGCVYTAQGFEYDWNGVILGPDLVVRDGVWVPRRDRNRDPDFRGGQRVTDGEFDRLVRNVYKVLLTRGMLGTVIYAVDEQTRDFLRLWVPELAPRDRTT